MIERFRIQTAGKGRIDHQRLELGRKLQSTRLTPIKEWLLPCPVARQEHPLSLGIVDGEGEHAVDAPEAFDIPLTICLEQNFSIARRAEPVALGQQRLSQLAIVVDLAVEDDLQPRRIVFHWLIRGRREVDDRKSAVAERDALVSRSPLARTVRPAMMEDSALQTKDRWRRRLAPRDANNAAHIGLDRKS